jgi:hypothetical protein
MSGDRDFCIAADTSLRRRTIKQNFACTVDASLCEAGHRFKFKWALLRGPAAFARLRRAKKVGVYNEITNERSRSIRVLPV